MSNADDRCAMVGCGSVRGSIIHAIGLKSDRSGHHPFVEGPGPYCRLPFGHFEPTPQPEPSGETAEQMRTRLGWPPLTDEQKRANLEQNLQSLGVAGGERREPATSGDEAKVREIARAEAESIATRWVPAHMTARQGMVDDIAASLVRYRALGRDEACQLVVQAYQLLQQIRQEEGLHDELDDDTLAVMEKLSLFFNRIARRGSEGK